MDDARWTTGLSVTEVDTEHVLDQPSSSSFVLEAEAEPRLRHRGIVLRRALLASDLLCIATAFLAAEAVYHHRPEQESVSAGPEIAVFMLSLPLWGLVALLYGLYQRDDSRVAHTTIDEVVHIFHMLTVCTWGFFAIANLTGVAHPQIAKLILFWLLATALLLVGRVAVRSHARSTRWFRQSVVIVGAGDVGQTLAEKLIRHPEYGLDVLGFIDAEPKEQRPSLEHLTILGVPENLAAIIEEHAAERVIIAFSRDSQRDVLDILRSLKDVRVQIEIVPRYFEIISTRTGLSSIEGLPVLGLGRRDLSPTARLVKRTFDIVVGTVALILLSPLLIALALVIRIDDGGAALFKQPRIGYDGQAFWIYKFRTMVRGADEQKQSVADLNKHAHAGGDPRMFKIPGDPRITRVGRMLRRRSLDELPQLINVLKGQMSLVGPRPLIPEEAYHVGLWGRRRLDLRPGMTGLWQTLGRSEIPFDEMVRLDYLYVTTWSLWNDLKLLCQTVPLVLRSGRGAY
jgi:exopolysaccharide biosynthesis polyprenyl glycosylphosphotransferase